MNIWTFVKVAVVTVLSGLVLWLTLQKDDDNSKRARNGPYTYPLRDVQLDNGTNKQVRLIESFGKFEEGNFQPMCRGYDSTNRYEMLIRNEFLHSPQARKDVLSLATQYFYDDLPNSEPYILDTDITKAMNETIKPQFRQNSNIENLKVQAARILKEYMMRNRYVEHELADKYLEKRSRALTYTRSKQAGVTGDCKYHLKSDKQEKKMSAGMP